MVRSRPVRARPRSRVAPLAVLVAALAAVSLPSGGGAGTASSLRERAGQLRVRDVTIAASSKQALLAVYSLDASLDRARARLESLRHEAAAVERTRAGAANRLRIARRAVALSQRQLADRLRALYEQSQPEPLAIVLGARSLDDALTAIEDLDRTASLNERVIEQARGAAQRLRVVTRQLADREARLRTLEAEAVASAAALAGARADKAAYLARLASARRLNAREIASLDRQAQAIEARAEVVAAQRATAAPAVLDPAPAGAAPAAPTAGRTITVLATGYALAGRTATGAPVAWGVVAVDPSVIPLGTRLTIPGYGEGVAADTGPGIQGATIDLWFPTKAQARAWGRRTVTVTLH